MFHTNICLKLWSDLSLENQLKVIEKLEKPPSY